ncbi:MAG: hypothetical protein ACRD21_17465, partial [Vicinamibacteria bacterium]
MNPRMAPGWNVRSLAACSPLLWLLAAAGCGGTEEHVRGHRIDLLRPFGGELVAETRRIDFGPLEPASTALLDEGWSYREEGAWDGKAMDWVWAAAPRVSLRFYRFRRGPITMRLRLSSVPGARGGTLRPRVNGEALPEIQLQREWSEHDVPIPERLVRAGRNELELDLAGVEPVTSRQLRVGFDRIDFVADVEPAAADPPTVDHGDPLRVRALQALKYTVRVPADATLRVRYDARLSSGACSPELGVFTEGIEPASRTAVIRKAPNGTRLSHEEEISLRTLGGRVVDIYVANS